LKEGWPADKMIC